MADITVSTTIDNFMQAADADAAKAILNIGAGSGGGTVQNLNLSIQATDEGTVSGDARGENSVDLQTKRSVASQVAEGSGAVIGGGINNTSSGYYLAADPSEKVGSTVSGGTNNLANFGGAVIAGGADNTASGYASAIGGGYNNTISGYYSAIVGGLNNTISYTVSASTILGGKDNNVSGSYSIASGRNADTGTNSGTFAFADSTTTVSTVIPNADNQFAIKAAGGLRLVDGNEGENKVLTCDANGVGTWQAAAGGGGGGGGQVDSVVAGTNVTIDNTDPINPIINAAGGGGGGGGTVQGTDGTYDVKAVASDDFVTPDARGENSIDLQTKRAAATQVASEQFSSILGGKNNTSSGYYSTVINGRQNSATALYATVLNGDDNTVSGDYSIVGGYQNTVSGYYSSCVCGYNNTVSVNYACVVSGYGNTNSGYISSMLGGYNNTIAAAGRQSTLGGGFNNTIESPDSFIGGGIDNTIPTGLDAVMIVGSGITADRSNCTFVNNLSIMNIPTASTGLPAGSVWNDSGTLKIV